MLSAICIHREFNVWLTVRSSPIVEWLRALARKAHAECGGRGVGAIGMCFTGGFALAMMTESSVVAPVLSQPLLPAAAMSKRGAAGIDAAQEEVACARKRFEDENLSMIGLRFKSDRSVPDARFETLSPRIWRQVRGDRTGRCGRCPSRPTAPFRADHSHARGGSDQGRRAAGDRLLQGANWSLKEFLHPLAPDMPRRNSRGWLARFRSVTHRDCEAAVFDRVVSRSSRRSERA
jgi:hypothetical protein